MLPLLLRLLGCIRPVTFLNLVWVVIPIVPPSRYSWRDTRRLSRFKCVQNTFARLIHPSIDQLIPLILANSATPSWPHAVKNSLLG